MYPSNVRCERSFACYHRSDYHNGPVAQLVRAPPCHGGGRGFEPHPGRLRKRKIIYGILAQLGEHLPYKQRVTGSSPVGPIYSYADVAQLAEQLICNQQVIGSSPIIGLVLTGLKDFGPLAQLVRAIGS